jgi:hypothetical protein
MYDLVIVQGTQTPHQLSEKRPTLCLRQKSPFLRRGLNLVQKVTAIRQLHHNTQRAGHILEE